MARLTSTIPENFNPRSRKGSDNIDGWDKREYYDFNPRSRKGSDSDMAMTDMSDNAFQSTLPQGERREVRYSAIEEFIISIHAPARGATI